jgi:RHS repeat-associated protein
MCLCPRIVCTVRIGAQARGHGAVEWRGVPVRPERGHDAAGGAERHAAHQHLNSASLAMSAGGGQVTDSSTRYYPYGGTRSGGSGLPTEYRYTGQRRDPYINLYEMGARWYDADLGRWISPDTIVPQAGNPQALNRYSYVNNSPLKFVDPTGHCWGFASGLRGTGAYGATCSNMDMALTIVQSPNASAGEKALAGGYIAVEGAAHVAVVAGTAVLAWEGAAATAAALSGSATATGAAGTAGTAATAACADGDCTNEANAAVQTVQGAAQAAQSVWRLNPFQRGVAIENMLGRSPQLAQNFPVIDRFENGVATSIKSMDLNAASYQNIGTLTSRVQGYVNTLANWQGARWGDVRILADQITGREVLLAIPPGASQAQMAALQQLQQWATTINVTLNITVVP